MKTTIDCDENDITVTDEASDNGFVQICISYKNGDVSCADVMPKVLIKALLAFLES